MPGKKDNGTMGHQHVEIKDHEKRGEPQKEGKAETVTAQGRKLRDVSTGGEPWFKRFGMVG